MLSREMTYNKWVPGKEIVLVGRRKRKRVKCELVKIPKICNFRTQNWCTVQPITTNGPVNIKNQEDATTVFALRNTLDALNVTHKTELMLQM